MDNEQLIDTIEAWIKGKLPPSDAAAFQAKIDADPSLAEQVALHRLTLKAMDHLSEQHLQQNVQSWMEHIDLDEDEEVPEKIPDKRPGQPVAPPSPRNWALVAATLLLLLAGAFVFVQYYQTRQALDAQGTRIAGLAAQIRSLDSLNFELKQRQNPNTAVTDSLTRLTEQLQQQLEEATQTTATKPSKPFADYSKPIFRDDLRGRSAPADQLVKDGIAAFKKPDLKKAEDKARAALNIEQDNRDARHLLAHALFSQQRFIEAEVEFSKLKNEYANNSQGARDAEWNQLLCHRALASVDTRQRELYRAALEQILRDNNSPYYKQALQLKKAQ